MQRLLRATTIAAMLATGMAPIAAGSAPLDQQAAARLGDRGGRLGIEFAAAHLAPTATPGGWVQLFRVSRLLPDSAAHGSGLQAGDLFWALDGQDFVDTEAVRFFLRSREPGRPMRISVLRGDRLLDINVIMQRADRPMAGTFGASPSPPVAASAPPPRLGIAYQRGPDLYAARDRRPVRSYEVTEVFPQGSAAAVGLYPGDLIFALDGWSPPTVDDFAAYLANRPRGAAVRIEFFRDGSSWMATARLGGAPPSIGRTQEADSGGGGLTTGEWLALGAGAVAAALIARGVYCAMADCAAGAVPGPAGGRATAPSARDRERVREQWFQDQQQQNDAEASRQRAEQEEARRRSEQYWRDVERDPLRR